MGWVGIWKYRLRLFKSCVNMFCLVLFVVGRVKTAQCENRCFGSGVRFVKKKKKK
eukprot:NODE_9383_length_228_cov_32.759777_g8768_i0.p2 GENE.NODE_9383_length_228_cov_32.759777_g8768_i0~~NODE_9383_length_228_cov_32.759777_g8768_i0.p2  ORF type:complete len:55 (+),score=8.51 NODE_9383_length_228_cov_32.759777_g8768_i0:28-192(+)